MYKKINHKRIFGLTLILSGISFVLYSFAVEKINSQSEFVSIVNNPAIEITEKSTQKEVLVKEQDKKINSLVLRIDSKSINAYFNEGENLGDIMNVLKRNGQVNFSGRNYSGLGLFIDEINGLKNGNKNNWIYYINNKKADFGVSYYLPKNADVIEWKYEKEY